MQHEQQAIYDALDDLPLNEKLASLVLSCLVNDPAISVEIIIDVALVMARHLPADQRARIIWHLTEVAAELDARWN